MMSKEEIRKLQVMELVYMYIKEHKNVIDEINESFEYEVGVKLDLKEEEIDEFLEEIRHIVQD